MVGIHIQAQIMSPHKSPNIMFTCKDFWGDSGVTWGLPREEGLYHDYIRGYIW